MLSTTNTRKDLFPQRNKTLNPSHKKRGPCNAHTRSERHLLWTIHRGCLRVFFLKSANRNAAAQPSSTTKYSQVFIGVPGGALDLGGVLAIGTSAMADGRVPRFAEIAGNPQFGAC